MHLLYFGGHIAQLPSIYFFIPRLTRRKKLKAQGIVAAQTPSNH